MKRLSIILPVYNEEGTIRELLTRVFSQSIPLSEKEIIIVESNSKDRTRDVVKAFVEEYSGRENVIIKAIYQDAALGKGNAVREGFLAATGDIVLIQDGDLEYDLGDYPLLLEPILLGKTSFVLGSRHLAAGSWKIRTFENQAVKATLMNMGGVLFHGIFNLMYGQKLTDPTTMFKVFERRCLKGLNFTSNRFDFDFELVAKLIRAGFVPLEVAVSYRSRGFEEGKKIRVFRDPFTWLWAIVKFRFSRLYA